jgi:molybdate transport system substrate-binding protein
MHGVLALLVALATLVPLPAHAAAKAGLRVFAAASLTDAFTEIAHTFESRHPDVDVQLNFAGSQQLVAQIEQGAGADVFASADDRWMGYARDHGLLSGAPASFTRNELVLIVPKSNPARIKKLQDLQKGGLKIVTGINAVPVGHYTRQVLNNLSNLPGFDPRYAQRVLANIVSEEENVKSIASKVQLGEADAGIVYRSDVTPGLARYVRTIPIPDEANVVATYPIAPVAHAARPADAQAFVALVLSDEGQRVLTRWGFLPLAASTP